MASLEDEVRSLIAAGKCKQAVELAKEHHKKSPTAESQQLLVQAYVARIQQFQTKGMGREAQTLITLVQERFPSERHQLQALQIRAMADAGQIDDLLRPLASDQTSPEIRTLIESTLTRTLTDLPAIASCKTLPTDHPIRKGAAAVWTAFVFVTSGSVTEEQIALPEISRRSPFAAWKMLIRAIAAFYKNDDDGCRRALEAIPGDAAVANLAQTLRSLAEKKKPSGGIAAVLYDRVRASDAPLRAALDKIERAFRIVDLGRLLAGIRDAVRLCALYQPQLLERLRQHISIACMLHDVPADIVVSALGSTIKNAYFWRLQAIANESEARYAPAVLSWERFLRHAVDEKMFAADSIEAATIWLHIAEMVAPLRLDLLDRIRDRLAQSRFISSCYENQPVAIARLKPKSEHDLVQFVLSPGRGFEQAALIRPETATFTKWIDWAERVTLPSKEIEDIALKWHKALPNDVQPLLKLASLAEARNALTMAVKRIGEAEALDPLNQQVRRARVRLMLSITWRHFADKKPHLVEKDIAELQALPGMNEGERAGVLHAIRAVWHQTRGDEAAKAGSFQAVVDRLGSITAEVLYDSILKMAKLGGAGYDIALAPDTPPLDIAKAQATAIRLADDLKLKVDLPVAWTPMIAQVLKQRPCPLPNSDLFLLGRGGPSLSEMEIAYLATAAGLIRTNPPAVTAKFLLLRASCLTQPRQRARTMQCLRAALELARQANDQDLMRDIFAVVDRDFVIQRALTDSRDAKGLPGDVLQKVVETESRADAYPKNPDEVESFVVHAAISEQRGRPPQYADDDWDSDDDDDGLGPGLFDSDEEDDEDDGGVPGGFPGIDTRQLNELMNAAGVSSPEEMLDDPAKLIAAMAKLLGKKLSQAEMRVLAEQLSREVATGFSGGTAKEQKKKRR